MVTLITIKASAEKEKYMEEILRIIRNKTYLDMSNEEMISIARIEFRKFDDDRLKTEFLTLAFSKLDKDKLSMSPEKCARLLVESGTYESGQ